MPNLFRHPTEQVFFVFKIASVVINNHRPAQSPRVGFVLFLDKKNQKSSQQIGFFAAQAFALQTGQNHGLQLFCPASPALSPCFCKNLLCPCSRTRPPLFCPLSPEAYLLTGLGKDSGDQDARDKKEVGKKKREIDILEVRQLLP
ncbi:hypothetical protein [Mucilaginibacter sp. SJ]|uniref:hypothetical protein n=1 Tax=Mucilaginibacter sp. SJ TaxID=3029053 RepID=UPI0023A964C3|nr:hypothetical protein [Mucilaginibacter sp. SJ]WEA00831.1 hypothetical protein MusilaSJ_25590 [Mucilaginibacter sp. SJ]